jgi:plasmid rolling circle replication initiator protein Rep
MNASDVLNRLTYHKIRQGPLLDYLEKVDDKLASRMAGCGSWLHLREFELSGVSKIRNANFCKCPLGCPACAARRAMKLVSAYEKRVLMLQDMQPELIPCMVTLTIKNRPDLGEGLRHFKDSWGRMTAAARKGKSLSSRHGRIEWNKVSGSVRAIECKLGKGSGLWHPHGHAFVLATEPLDKFHLSAEWERFTGDSMIVDVTPCNNGIVNGLIEVLKYVSKPCELPPDLIYHLMVTAKGSRFVDPQGCLRGVPEPVLEQDDDEGCVGPFREFIALWRGFGYSLESVSKRLEILKPGDPGYGPPREIVYQDPGPEDPFAPLHTTTPNT